MKFDDPELLEAARKLRQAIYTQYIMVMRGDTPPALQAVFKQMTNPLPGNIVIEVSTYGHRDRDWCGVGTLEKITTEPIPNWEETPDDPNPGELCYYVRLLDNETSFRWTNASIVAASNHGSARYGV